MENIKKYMLAAVASLASTAALAGISFPMDFEKHFGYVENDLEGWTVYAPEGHPAGEYAGYFENYSPDNAVVIAYGIENVISAWTNSDYIEGTPSDTWLITPEFEVTGDKEIIGFNISVVGMDNLVSNNFAVYISEGGVEKSDFKLLQKSSIQGSIYGYDYLEMANKRYALTGYKGKKVRLAFVNEGNYEGIMGFGDITVSSWYATGFPSADSIEQIVVESGAESTSLQWAMKVSTPVTLTRYNVDFATSGGFKYSAVERRQLRLSELTTINFKVPDIKLSQPVESFTLTVTPDFEGAQPFVVSGKFIKADGIYPQVSVLEDATGTWCQYCPYGAIALDYYTDKYPYSGQGDKVIGIAVHIYSDPMQISAAVSDYYSAFMASQPIEGFPAIVFNRSIVDTPSPNPAIFGDLIENQFAAKSFVYGKLDKVYLNPDDDTDMAAVYSVTATYDMDVRPMNVSVVVTEDDVQGFTNAYRQVNSVPTLDDESSVVKQFGEDWLPYFQLYLDNPGAVPANLMHYDHVARAVYPSYAGVPVANMAAGEVASGKITFRMPTNVRLKENTNVILLVTDSETGEIITADQVPYSQFTMASGVSAPAEEASFSCALNGGTLTVTSACDALAELYTLDGRLVDRFPVSRGVNTRMAGVSNPVLLVKLSGQGFCKTLKLLNR